MTPFVYDMEAPRLVFKEFPPSYISLPPSEMLVPVTPPSRVKLNGFGMAPVIAAPLALKLARTVARFSEAQTVGAQGSVAVGGNVATKLQGVRIMSDGHV